MRKFRTIYEVFIEYPEEEVDYVISNLSDEWKRLLYLRYNKDLNNPDPSNFKREYTSMFYQQLLKQMEKSLEAETKIQTIYQRFKDHPKEEVDRVLSLLTSKDHETLYLRYGSDLENPDSRLFKKKYKREFRILVLKIKLLLENKLEPRKTYQEEEKSENYSYSKFPNQGVKDFQINSNLLNVIQVNVFELKKEKYKSLVEIYSLKKVLIGLLLIRLNNKYDYGLKDILETFNIKIEELKEINEEIVPLLISIETKVLRK